MKLDIFPKGRSVIFTWLLSYLLILIIPVAISGITYIKTSEILETEINTSNTLLLKKMQEQMDGVLHYAERLSQEMASNYRLADLLRLSGEMNPSQDYELYRTIRELGIYNLSGSAVVDFYVYLRNMDYVISGYACRPAKVFFDIYVSDKNIDFYQWSQLVRGSYRGNHFATFKPDKDILLVRSIPFIYQGEASANIVMVLDGGRLMEDVRDIEPLNDKGTVFILDNNNRLIAASNPMEGIQSIRYEELGEMSGRYMRSMGDVQVVVSYETSRLMGLKYVAAVPYSVFWERAQYTRNLAFAGLLLCLLLGGFITFYALKTNYNPIRRLVRLLEKEHGLAFDMSHNELSFIQQVVNKLQSDKEKSDIIIKQQNKKMKSELLARILKGKIPKKLPVQDSLALYEIEFETDYFAVMVFYIEDLTGLLLEDQRESCYEKFKFVQFVVTNVVEELAGQRSNRGLMTDIDDMLVCLINFSEAGAVNAKEEMSRIADESRRFLSGHFNINLMVAVSGVHKTMAGIPAAYGEALCALEYKRVLGIEEFIHYEDIHGLPKGDYYYPLEVEQQIINFIKTGDFEKSSGMLEDIFHRNFDRGILSVKIARCLMFNLVSTMIKAIHETGNTGNKDFLEDLNPVEGLLACESIQEMKQELTGILKIFCGYIRSRNRSRNKKVDRSLGDRVRAYVSENYMNPNLGVTTIAQEFNVHLVHLSKSFKELFGEGLLDFINGVRVREAKKRLKEGGSLEAAAKAAGYTNLRTFTRVFKKYEGITPGKFKEMK